MSRSPFLFCIALSAAAWALLFAIFPPGQQNFPLWDDFAFSQGAFLFAQGEGIHYLNWASMPQLGLWIWACPFIWCFGPSHVGLRAATITLSGLGLWGFYDLVRQRAVPPDRAALATAALAFNPYFFILQGMFMTDVPALSFGLVALALYGRAFASARRVDLFAAALAATLAAMTRQNMMAVPLAAAVLLWRRPVLRWRPVWLAGVAAPLAMGLAVNWWLQGRRDVWSLAPTPPPPHILLLLPFLLLHFCGLAALPVLALTPRPHSWKRFLAALAIMTGGAAYWWEYGKDLFFGGVFPYCGDFISPWGVFRDLMAGKPPLVFGMEARVALTLAGCLGGAALLSKLIRHRREPPGPLAIFALLQIPLLLAAPLLFDRYLLTLAPAALLLAATDHVPQRPAWPLAAGVLAASAIVSIALEHDWLSMSIARWNLGQRAVTGYGIDVWDLEGGLNWDGWHTSSPRPPGVQRGQSYRFKDLLKWFPHISARYALSYSLYPRAIELDSEPYGLWLPPQRGRLFLIRQPVLGAAIAEPPWIALKDLRPSAGRLDDAFTRIEGD
jgi:hypothetical protein